MSTIYSPTNEPRQHAGIFIAAATACIVVVLAVAAVAGFAVGRHSVSNVTPSAPSHAVTPANPVMPTPVSSTVPSGAIAAINGYETQNGPGVGKWVIESAQVSKVNPMYVFFRIGPAKGFEDSVQGGYGFALDSGHIMERGRLRVGSGGMSRERIQRSGRASRGSHGVRFWLPFNRSRIELVLARHSSTKSQRRMARNRAGHSSRPETHPHHEPYPPRTLPGLCAAVLDMVAASTAPHRCNMWIWREF